MRVLFNIDDKLVLTDVETFEYVSKVKYTTDGKEIYTSAIEFARTSKAEFKKKIGADQYDRAIDYDYVFIRRYAAIRISKEVADKLFKEALKTGCLDLTEYTIILQEDADYGYSK